ncbi:uncharacterized protein H6S33_007934 [Morchella sextelata]|uniref:uncharacterized protein n=1 Tax=Morchella sextelata TaxID=1174677 RepID=UPI001D044E34|nr:uncharacterized protein H6S33_007934 [Morchella sextelata]KAH0602930.1 hypothetical protein H6S33_007934 [Morchella sextelata]
MRTRSTRNAKKRLAPPPPTPPPPPTSALAALIPDPGALPDNAAHLQYLQQHQQYTEEASWSVFISLSVRRLQVRRYHRAVAELRAAPPAMSIAEGREWARGVFTDVEFPAEGDVWGVVREQIRALGVLAREAVREMEALWRIVEAWEGGYEGFKGGGGVDREEGGLLGAL